jgi:KaiC/GvpD/RAD55 family RecA-like ATPase
MKTTLCYSIIHYNAREEGRTGVYLTLEQSKRSLLRGLESFGFEYDPAAGKVNIQDLAWIRKTLKEEMTKDDWMETGLKTYLKRLKDQLEMELLVIDSLPVVETLARFEDPRDGWFQFLEFIRDDLKCTTFLITEDNPEFPDVQVGFLSDGIIELQLSAVAEVNLQLRLRCLKMRGTHHGRQFLQLERSGPGSLEATQIFTEAL